MNTELWLAVASIVVAATAAVWVSRIRGSARQSAKRLAVGVGTVRTVAGDRPEAVGGEREIWIEVSSVQGDTFVGRLVHHGCDADLAALRPGLVVLVAFDPASRERLSLPDDVLAVRASGPAPS